MDFDMITLNQSKTEPEQNNVTQILTALLLIL